MTYSEMIVARISTLCEQREIAYNKLVATRGPNQFTIDNIVRGVTKGPRAQTPHHIALEFNMTLVGFLDYPELNEYSSGEEEY